jgi:thiol-disulfide isomerase/thioredoxin
MSQSDFSRSSESEQNVAPPAERGLGIWPWIVLLVAVVLVAVYLMAPPAGRQDAGDKHPAVGTRIEELTLEPLTGGGEPVTVSSLDGKVTLINFWGPWCPPCRMEFPHIVEIEQHFRGEPRFQLLSVSCSGHSGSEEEMGPMTAEFLAEQKAEFPTYRDPYQRLGLHLDEIAKLNGFVFPTSVVVGPDRTIRGLWPGYAPGDERDIYRVIETTLGAAKKQ